ncbi:MAG: glycosyltransferase [Thermoplasmata archaeon]
MHIAIVIPSVNRISGNRPAILIGKKLAEDNDVDILCYQAEKTVAGEIKKFAGRSSVIIMNEKDHIPFGILFALKNQVLRGSDRKIARKILSKERDEPYDLVFVIANEGHWIPIYLKHKKIKTAIMIMELHEHGLIQYKGVKRNLISSFYLPFYPFIRFIERNRFLSFDYVFSNSMWTSMMFQYFYGIETQGAVAPVDSSVFLPATSHDFSSVPFIAVPTVSLKRDKRGIDIVKKLHSEGINIISFGPFEIKGIPYVGFLSDENVIKILGEASATLFLFNYEALGLIPIESLMCGTPVITYPKQGPYMELNGNRFVTFSNDYDEIKEACDSHLKSGKSDPTEIRNTVMRFSIETAVKRIKEVCFGIN